MNIMPRLMATAMLAAPAVASVASAQGVGALAVDVPAQTDTRVSVPVTNDPFGAFAVAASGVSGNTVTLKGASFDGQFPLNSQGNASYYARFTGGGLAGRWFDIVDQTGDSITLNVENTGEPADLSAVSEDDELLIIEHLTVSQILPDNLEGLSFTSSPNPFQPGFQVLLPRDDDGTGTNIAATTTVIFNDSTQAWITLGGAPADDIVVAPQATLILRNTNPVNTGNPDDPRTVVDESTGDLKLLPAGQVLDVPVIEAVRVEDVQNDTTVGVNNFFPLTFAESGLDTVINNSPSPFQPGDQVLVFEPPVAGGNFNIAPTTTLIRVAGSFLTLSGSPADGQVIQPGDVVILRKAAGAADDLVEWVVQP